jgi:hypothetical protein
MRQRFHFADVVEMSVEEILVGKEYTEMKVRESG